MNWKYALGFALLLMAGCSAGHNNCPGGGSGGVFKPWDCRDIPITHGAPPKTKEQKEQEGKEKEQNRENDPEHQILTQ